MSANPFLASAGIPDPGPAGAGPLPPPNGAGLDAVTGRIAQIEGDGQNPRSSARGIGQFTDSTLLGTYRRHYGQNGMSDAQVLALKDDPAAMRSMLGLLVQDNASALGRNGHDTTPGNLYLANYFGPGGADAILRANPSTPIEQIVGLGVMQANPQLKGKSAGDMIAWTASRMGGTQPTDQPPSLVSAGNGGGNSFLTLAGIAPQDGAAVPQGGDPASSVASPAGPSPSVNDFLATAPQAPQSGPSNEPGMLSRMGEWATQADPLFNAAVNGGSFLNTLQDRAAGAAHGVARAPELGFKIGAWALDNIVDPITSALGASTDKTTAGSAKLRNWADRLENWTSNLAHDPTSPAFTMGDMSGTIAATAPAAELRLIEALPAVGRTVAARNIALAAGDALPMNMRMAAALARYGDMAIGGAAAGAMASGGKDVGSNAIAGALLAPVAGAATEKVLAPIMTRAGGEAQKLAQGIRDLLPNLGDGASAASKVVSPENQAMAAALSDLKPGSNIRTGAEIANRGVTMVTTPEGKVIPRIDIVGDAPASADVTRAGTGEQAGSPALGASSPGAADDRLARAGGSEGSPTPGTADTIASPTGNSTNAQPTVSAQTMDKLRDEMIGRAMGSQGAHNGIEATTDLPPAVAEHVNQLIRQGVPLDQAIREADITYAGAKPTIASVTRDPAHQQALNEGAKLVQTSEGRALNARMAANNAAVNAKMQSLVDRYGGVPAQGEAAEAAATSLAKAADAARAHVRNLYAQAAQQDGNATVRPDLLREVLHDPMNQATTSQAGANFLAGMQKRLDILTNKGTVGLGPDALELLRKTANASYEPIGGGEVNALVGKVKDAIDEGFDQLGEAGPAYAKARAGSRAYKQAYENPKGIAKLIARDNEGNFINQDNWRRAENGLLGTLSDQDLAQVTGQLKANGDPGTLDRVRASILQRAYNDASRGPADSGGNALASGQRYFDTLNAIGLPKLRQVFTPAELAEIASTGRAALHLNSQVPGTANYSNTASAALSNEMARRMMAGMAAAHGKAGGGVGVHAGASLLGAGATLLGHTVAGPVAGMAVTGTKLVADALGKRASARIVAQGLSDAMDPAAARAAARAREQQLAHALRHQALARTAGKHARALATGSDERARLAAAIRGVATPVAATAR